MATSDIRKAFLLMAPTSAVVNRFATVGKIVQKLLFRHLCFHQLPKLQQAKFKKVIIRSNQKGKGAPIQRLNSYFL
jgi:hypothetical protein